MNQELVSVIMPAYNAEKYIGMSITSVLQQTYKYVELIIVDDGSTDNTVEKVLAFANNWPDIINLSCRKENGGTAAALNDAIELARGKYICWLSADDMYCSEMVETEVDYLINNSNYDAVFSKCAYIDENNQLLGGQKYSETFEEVVNKNPKIIVSSLLQENFWHGCSVLAKAECFKCGERFDINYRSCQDYDFWLRMTADYEIGYLNRVNVLSREHAEQGSKNINCNLEEIKVFFNMLYKEDVIEKLLNKMELKYSFENISPYILSRIIKYRGREEETEIVKGELEKYYNLIKNGCIHFSS